MKIILEIRYGTTLVDARQIDVKPNSKKIPTIQIDLKPTITYRKGA